MVSMIQRMTGSLPLRFIRWMLRIAPFHTCTAFVLSFLQSVSSAVHVWLFSRVVSKAIDLFGGTEHIDTMLLWVAAWFGFSLASNTLWPLFQLQEAKLRQLLEEALLRGMHDKTERLRLEAFERNDFHDLLSRARRVSEPGFMLNLLWELFFVSGAAMRAGSVALVIAAWNPWLLAAVVTVSLPAAFVSWRHARLDYEMEKQLIPNERMRNYLQSLLTSREAAKEVRTFGIAGALLTGWRSLYWTVADAQHRQLMRSSMRHASVHAIGILGMVAGVAWCGWAVAAGGLTAGRFAGMLIALETVNQSVNSLLERSGYVRDSLLRIGDFFTYMDLGPEEQPGQKLKLPTPGKIGTIELENVGFRYPLSERFSLDAVTCRIEPGEKIALVGENGSGKTTLVKLLMGLFTPTAGVIRYGGIDSAELEPGSLRERLSVVFQDFNRYSASLRDNIGFGNYADLDDPDKIAVAAARGGADEVASALAEGYSMQLTRRFDGGVDLSGGQWQKVAISRAFMRDAAAVSLDEPTAALDPVAESDVFRRFLGVAGDKTAFLVSHRLGLARYCDRIFVMRNGRLVEQGTHDELLAAGGDYSRMWRLQAQWYT